MQRTVWAIYLTLWCLAGWRIWPATQLNLSALLVIKDVLGKSPCSVIVHQPQLEDSRLTRWIRLNGLRERSCGRNQEAALAFQSLLVYEPNDLLIAMALADSLAAQGRTSEASNLINRFPDRARVMALNFAYKAKDAGDVLTGVMWIERAMQDVERFPVVEQASVWRAASFVYEAANRPTDAANAQRMYAELEPNNPDIWGRLGDLYLNTADYSLAIQAFRRSLALNSNNNQWRLHLGDAYLAFEKPLAALAEYQIIFSTNVQEPALSWTRISSARALVRLGDSCGAAKHLRLALRSDLQLVRERADLLYSQLSLANCVGE